MTEEIKQEEVIEFLSPEVPDEINTVKSLKERIILIEDNIKKTNQQISQLAANLNMLEGGRQECLHWLKIMDNSNENTK